LYATAIARQIKHDYPGSHLTWVISSRCEVLLRGNPYVDDVVTVELMDWSNTSRELAWELAKQEIIRKQTGPDPYNRVWMPQVFPDNFRFFDGTVRPSQFRGYDRPITVPIDPVICLTDEEKERAARFAAKHSLQSKETVVLFECSSNSSQSHVTPEFAKQVAFLVSQKGVEATIILSTMLPLGEGMPGNAISAGELSMRENLALLDYCSHFIGCGSGLTVVATADQAKPVPRIQILDSSKSVFASFYHDFDYWKKPTDLFIEMPDASAEQAAACLIECVKHGHAAAASSFHSPCPVTFDFLATVTSYLLSRGRYLDAAESLAHTYQRYPDREELREIARRDVLPLCPFDSSTKLPIARDQWLFVQQTFAL